jgi:hypothetical protein
MPKFNLDLHNIMNKFNWRQFSVKEVIITLNKLKFSVNKNQLLYSSDQNLVIYENGLGFNFPDL